MAFDYNQQQRYGAPPAQQYGPQGRPGCWSNERYYNPNGNECRRCPFAPSCRDEIVRIRNFNAQGQYPQPHVVAPPAYGYAIPPPPPVHATTVPVQYVPPPNAQPLARPMATPQSTMFPVPAAYQYGWLTDPLYYTMAASPPPPIPQLPGESYMARVGKNMAKSALLAIAEEAYFALRQWVWAPEFPQMQQPASTTVVDVPPQR